MTTCGPGRKPRLGAEHDRDAEAGQLVRDLAVVLVVAGVDGGDPRAAGREGPGDRRAGDAEPVDAYAPPGQAGAEAGQQRVRFVRRAHQYVGSQAT